MKTVTIWNEFLHECDEGKFGEICRKHYPDGMHEYLKAVLSKTYPDVKFNAVHLKQDAQGLPDDVLNSTDVLVWWGHCAHGQVEDELVTRIQNRVLGGMGLVVLHSGHHSKIFKRMMGTTCNLRWREVGEKERIWTIDPSHPIAQGVPDTFVIDNTEMYGERFDIPDDGKVVFMSWYEGGNVFRSGITFQRGLGKIFYFSPGHESLPIFHNENVQKVIANGIKWVAPAGEIASVEGSGFEQPVEKITTKNPCE